MEKLTVETPRRCIFVQCTARRMARASSWPCYIGSQLRESSDRKRRTGSTSSQTYCNSAMVTPLMDDDSIDALTALGEDLIASIFDRKSQHDIASIIQAGAPIWYQNEPEHISPLHAAAYIQHPALVKFLIEKGAVWNAGILAFFLKYQSIHSFPPVDEFGHTAADIALSYNNSEIYTLIRDAGIRSGNSYFFMKIQLELSARQRCFLPCSQAKTTTIRPTSSFKKRTTPRPVPIRHSCRPTFVSPRTNQVRTSVLLMLEINKSVS